MKTYLSIFLFLFLLASCSSNDDQEQEIINQPQCLTPTSISINNITENSAVINWSNTEGSSSYEIEFGVSGFTQGSGTQLMSNLNTIIIDNLTPETDYDIYNQLCI